VAAHRSLSPRAGHGAAVVVGLFFAIALLSLLVSGGVRH
jgi:hypothetical protein